MRPPELPGGKDGTELDVAHGYARASMRPPELPGGKALPAECRAVGQHALQ